MIIKCKDFETYVMYNTLVIAVLLLLWLFLVVPVIGAITHVHPIPILRFGGGVGIVFALWRIIWDKSLKDGYTVYMMGTILLGIVVPAKYVLDKFIKYEIVKEGDSDGH